MKQVVLPSHITEKLAAFTVPVQVFDESDKLLGHFIPVTVWERLKTVKPSLSQVDVQELLHLAKNRPWNEVVGEWEHKNQLAS